MKKLFFLIGTILAFFTIENNMQAQNFQISCQRIFTPTEEANIDFYQYGNRRDKKETTSNKPLEVALYKVEDTDTFLQYMVKNQGQKIADDVLQNLPLLRSWEQTPSNGRNGYRREALKLGKLEEGIYVVEVINGGAMTASVPVFISQYGVLNRTIGNDLIAYAHNLQTGKSESNFEFKAIVKDGVVKPQGKDNNLACFDFTDYKNLSSHIPIFAQRGKSIAVSKVFIGRTITAKTIP